MAPTPSTPEVDLPPRQRQTLVEVARASIGHGLKHGYPLAVTPSEYARELKAVRASFVTLQINERLRGCIGHLEAVQPVIVDVAENAFAAAFRDPRFSPLTEAEWPNVALHLSLLTPAEAIAFSDEDDLVAQIRPGLDGLILEDGPNRGTFLPSVWESLPEPRQFLTHLKIKAGLAANHWSAHTRVLRYRTESFGDEVLAS